MAVMLTRVNVDISRRCYGGPGHGIYQYDCAHNSANHDCGDYYRRRMGLARRRISDCASANYGRRT